MKETSLSAAIDKAAMQRAVNILVDVRNAVKQALDPYWRPKGAGSELISKDINTLLEMMARSTESFNRITVRPSAEMVNACRGAIVEDLLNGLPKLKELFEMANYEEADG